MPTTSVFARILASRKAVILILIIVALTVLCALGRITSTQLLTFLTVTVPAWMLAQGFEDGMVKPAAINAASAAADRAADPPPAPPAP